MRGRVFVLLLALAAAGCGGSGGGAGPSSDAAGIVPANALAYITVNTDLGSGQLQNAKSIVDKFPIKDKALAAIKSSLAQSGVNVDKLVASIGPVVDVAVLRVNGSTTAVGFAKPTDEQTFAQQLDAGTPPHPLHEQISGWTVFSDKQAALDAVKNRSAALADQQSYKDATGTVPAPGDTLARAYVAPSAFSLLNGVVGPSAAGTAQQALANVKWAAAAAIAQAGAVKIEAHVKGLAGGTPGTASLADQIPSGALVAFSFDGSGSQKALGSAGAAVGQASKQLGVDLQALLGALNGPAIGYVRSGVPLPEITLAAKPKDPAAAEQAIGALIRKLTKGAAQQTTAGGVTLNRVALGPVQIYYGTFGGELVVTDSANAVSELKGGGDRLSGDPTFKDAKSGSGLPDTGASWIYVNIKDALPALDAVASLAGSKIPPSVENNLKPLSSFMGYGTAGGDTQTVVAYLKTS